MCHQDLIDLKAAGGSIVHYYLFIYLLGGQSSRCKHDIGTLSWLNAEALEAAAAPLFGRLALLMGTLSPDYSTVHSTIRGYFQVKFLLEGTAQTMSQWHYFIFTIWKSL